MVAQRLLGLMVGPRCREELRDAFASLGDADGWIAALAGLHDLGKLSPAFQALRVDLAERLLGPEAAGDLRRLPQERAAERTDTRHGVLTAAFLTDLLREWGARPQEALQISSILGGHHGIVPGAGEIRQGRNRKGDSGTRQWPGWRRELVGEYVRLLGLPDPASLPWVEVRPEAGALVSLAGLTSVSDWIASDLRKDDFAGENVDLAAYLVVASERIRRAIHKLGWIPWQPPPSTGFTALFPEVDTVRPVQAAVERLVDRMAGPGIVVVEAPTGEGKTKAALQAAAMFVHKLGLVGMYVAMPTKATSRRMLEEAQELVDHSPVPLRVRLLQGADDDQTAAERVVEAGEAEPLDLIDVNRDGPDETAGSEREWFTRKKGLIFPVGVGTVDQVLRTAIRTWHGFVGLAGVSGKVVVIDEVHAYDTYMSMLLDRLLAWLGRLGVPVILLSATLPSARREELVTAWRAGLLRCSPRELPTRDVPDEAQRYPLVTWADADGYGAEPVDPCTLNADRVVRLERVQDEDVVSWVLRRIESGGCAAVIHNLVRSVHATYDSLQEAIRDLPEDRRPELISLHARMESAQRRRAENRIREALGPPSEDRERPGRFIVVGTQILEQSLDYDVDVMVSDLAPVDSLIQRMGRLGRHPRGERDLVLGLCGFTDTGEGPRFPAGVSAVYQSALLLRTWACLQDRSEIHSPDDVRELIEAVYRPGEAISCPPGWERRWDEAAERMNGRLDRERAEARELYLPFPRPGLHAHELTHIPYSATATRLRSGRP
ncbi:CRISPR-associated helicase/endonuclease Cas3 [Actinoallomurus liliacearum]|uniref:CRISPR-associated helicase/endonuclease Cas3 n=1 Tax=Actinoallomurus liliacearum TaxID=1080073 RepID=A0ABP8TGP0_9ACTN